VSRGTWETGRERQSCRLQDYRLLWLFFPKYSATIAFGDSPAPMWQGQAGSHDTGHTTPTRLTCVRFGLVPVRSPLLGESRLLSCPPGTEMVHFPGFASPPYGFR
jgi:hypothetical protein